MYLLIDLRTSCPSDIPNIYYAISWANLWKELFPHDQITLLAFDGDPVRSEHHTLFIPRGRTFLSKKRLAIHRYGPDRIISFSRLPSIEKNIPSIHHVSDISSGIFPQPEKNLIAHHFSEYFYKKNLQYASHIIIPEQEVGAMVGEIYDISESKMSVIPHIETQDKDVYEKKTVLPHGLTRGYFLTEGTPGDEWNPIELIDIFAKYILHLGGTSPLVILGDLGKNFPLIVEKVRMYGIKDSIKLLGVPTQEEQKTLYAQAGGWIYIGTYYSRGPCIGLANGYEIPLYISEIPGLKEYNGFHMHPNRIDSLAEILTKPYQKKGNFQKPNNALIMQVYKKIITD